MTAAASDAAKPPPGPAPFRRAFVSNSFDLNRLDEPPFQLKIEPEDKISFKSDKLTEESVTVEIKISNTSNNRQTFKVKCTSNDIFRVRPPIGFIAAGETFPINLVLMTKEVPPSNRHFFAFYHMSCKDDDENARALWTPRTKAEGVKRIPCEFLNANGTVHDDLADTQSMPPTIDLPPK